MREMNSLFRQASRFTLPWGLMVGLLCLPILVNASPSRGPDLETWRYAVNRELQFQSPERQSELVNEALRLSEELLNSQGTRYRRVTIQDSTFEALQILPFSDTVASPLNRLAFEASQKLSGLIIVYAPGVLMRGTAGFYSPKEHLMGISHLMLETNAPDSTFDHEIIHTSHALSRSVGILDPLSPAAKVISSDRLIRLSPHSRGYTRLQTFEEIEAHVESLRSLQRILPRRNPSPQEVREWEEVLDQIYHTADEGEGIALASADLAKRAMQKMKDSPDALEWEHLRDSPINEADLQIIRLRLNGASHRLTADKLTDTVELYWEIAPSPRTGKLPSRQQLISSLEKAIQISELILKEFAQVKSSMYWLIERVDGRQTDVNKVHQSIASIVQRFDQWKKANSITPVKQL